MITSLQAIILGLVQGATELFPVSSLGHSVIIPGLFGWNLPQNDPSFLTFLVATHAATALVLLGFFWRDWLSILLGLAQSVRERKLTSTNRYGRLGWLLIVGTIPAGLLGLLLEKRLQNLFTSPRTAAFVLILNGLMLLAAERLRRRQPVRNDGTASDQRLSQLSFKQAFTVGLSQILSLIPGFSRSGSTMSGGLLAGLSNEDAARFSFLLATPIIGAAAVLKLPEFLKTENQGLILPGLLGAFFAAAASYATVKYLVRYFETKRLAPFAAYCILAGIICLIWLR